MCFEINCTLQGNSTSYEFSIQQEYISQNIIFQFSEKY